jgi:hypothetical protein
MRHDPEQPKHGWTSRVGLFWVGRHGARWQGFLLIIAGWVGVGLTSVVAGAWNDPTRVAAVVSVAGLASLSVATIGAGSAISVATAISPTRHVFNSGPAFRTAAVLLGTTAVSFVLLIPQAPLDGILAHGLPLAEVIADLTYVAASLTCMFAGGVALRAARNARREERDWY